MLPKHSNASDTPTTAPTEGGLIPIWDALHSFKVARYRLTYRVIRPVAFEGYLGSVLRGTFGARLRWISCPSRTAPCVGCEWRTRCAYAYVFETPVPEGAERLRTHQDIPRPFVIEAPPPGALRLAAGDELSLGLILLGRAVDYLPHFILAFREIDRFSQGPGAGPGANVRLEEFAVARGGFGWRVDAAGEAVSDAARTAPSAARVAPSPDEVVWRAADPRRVAAGTVLTGREIIAQGPVGAPPGAPAQAPTGVAGSAEAAGDDGLRALTITFQTMTRLKHEAGYARRPEFHILVRSLLRRVSNLLYFHDGIDLGVDFRDLIARAGQVSLTHDGTRWQDWTRYSSRQGAAMDLGGFVGEARYAGDLDGFLPLLLIGEYVHVGKNATFGLGRMRLGS